jgi:hypothetical protein
MAKSDLERIKNFEIWNEFGKIRFLDPIDLIGVNLDNILIEKGQIYIHNLEKESKKLNLRGELELYGIDAPPDIEVDLGFSNFVRMLAERCEEKGAKFLDFDANGNILKFSVNKMKLI